MKVDNFTEILSDIEFQMNINHMLDNSINIFKSLNNGNNNVVIGGSLSLAIHGLNLHTIPKDVDMIIYSPSKQQIEILKVLSIFSEKNPVTNTYQRRSFKIKVNDIYIDIIVEHKKTIPNNLLILKHNNCEFKIQSIKNVFQARKEYVEHNQNIRVKDYISTIKLKELNFNIQ